MGTSQEYATPAEKDYFEKESNNDETMKELTNETDEEYNKRIEGVKDMNLKEIKKSLTESHKVCWKNELYDVVKIEKSYYIICNTNQHTISLTWRDGTTLNGKEKDFFIKKGVKK